MLTILGVTSCLGPLWYLWAHSCILWSDQVGTGRPRGQLPGAFGWGVSVLPHMHSPVGWLGSSPEAAGFQESKSESWMLPDCTMSPLPHWIGSNKLQDSLVKPISPPDRRNTASHCKGAWCQSGEKFVAIAGNLAYLAMCSSWPTLADLSLLVSHSSHEMIF